jgi:hypothetical protein
MRVKFSGNFHVLVCAPKRSDSAQAIRQGDVMSSNRLVLLAVLAALAILPSCSTSNGTTAPVAPPSGGFSNSNLNGTYVFSVSGTDTNNAPYAMVGSFTANGSGGITGGTLDLNDEAFPSSSPAISPVANSPISSSSSYSVGVDGRGQVKLNTSTPFPSPIVLDFVLQDNSHGLVTEFDTSASGSGSLDLQSSGTTLNGSYAFIFSGAYGSSLVSTVGNFTLGGSEGAVTGLEDFNSEGVPYPEEALSGTVVAGPSSTPATQLVAASTTFAITYDVYPIDASHLKFIEMDSNGTLSGDAYSQSSATVPTGTLAFTLMGLSSSQVVAAGGFMVTDGSGNITNVSTADVNNTGSVPASFVTFSGTYAPVSSGRSTLNLTSFVAGTNYAAYPSSGGLLLLDIDVGGIMMSGAALQQSSAASGLAVSQGYALNLSGTNLGGATGSPVEVDDIAEFATAASGMNLTGVTDENFAPGGTPNLGLALTGNYSAPDSNGRGTLAATAGNSTNGTLNGGFGITYYTVDGTVFPFIETDSGQVTAGVFLKQSSGSSSAAAARSHFFVMPRLVRPGAARKRN